MKRNLNCQRKLEFTGETQELSAKPEIYRRKIKVYQRNPIPLCPDAQNRDRKRPSRLPGTVSTQNRVSILILISYENIDKRGGLMIK